MLVVLPLIIPLISAALSMICWRRQRVQRILSMLGVSALLIASIVLFSYILKHGIYTTQVGSWPAPYGITLVADKLSAIMVLLTAISGFCISIYSMASIDFRREAFGYHPIFNVLLFGVCGSFLTGDLFNLFVWFEVVLMSSFLLLGLGSEKAQLESSIKYVSLNLFSSVLFLTAVALLYGLVGTLNMADLAIKVANGISKGHAVTLSMLFLVAFGIKSAIFPLYSWLPSSYHAPPIAVTSIFAAILTKVGVYSLIRIFSLIFVQDIEYTHGLILILSAFTMVTGVLGAMVQKEFRRLLAFYSVSQIGFMLFGLGLFTPIALAGSILFMIHHCFVKTNLFLISGLVYRLKGTFEIRKLSDTLRTTPFLAILFFISAMSSLGLPPFSGFFAKYILIYEGIRTSYYITTAFLLLTSLLTLIPIAKLWENVFLRPNSAMESSLLPAINLNFKTKLQLYFPIVILTCLTIGLGLMVGPIYSVVESAAYQLYDPKDYANAVLGRFSN